MKRKTKAEMIEFILSNGIDINNMSTLERVKAIYDGLLIKKKPEGEPEAEPEAAPEAEPEAAPEAEPEAAPEAEPEAAPEPEPEAAPETPQAGTPDSFDELFEKIKTAEGKTGTGSVKAPLVSKEAKKRKRNASSPDSFYIEGYILLMAVDTIFPFTFAWLNNIMSKQVKVSPTQLVLTEKDFTKLEPLANQAAEYLTFHINPVLGFALVSSFMYGNKLLIARMEIEKTFRH
jgi:hypothetical protein